MWSNPFDPEKMAYLTQEDIDNFSLVTPGVREVNPAWSPAQTRLYNRQAIQDAYNIPAPHRVTPSTEIAYYRSMLTQPQFRNVNLSSYIGYLANIADDSKRKKQPEEVV